MMVRFCPKGPVNPKSIWIFSYYDALENEQTHLFTSFLLKSARLNKKRQALDLAISQFGVTIQSRGLFYFFNKLKSIHPRHLNI